MSKQCTYILVKIVAKCEFIRGKMLHSRRDWIGHILPYPDQSDRVFVDRKTRTTAASQPIQLPSGLLSGQADTHWLRRVPDVI